MKKILLRILGGIKPTQEEARKIQHRVEVILNKINNNQKDARAILGGSGAKGTWLREANDSDIFVKFNYAKYHDKSEHISDYLEKILKKEKLKITRLHGSRDYFQIREKGYTSEIIPILDIKKAEQAKNITDVSPLHADWVNKNGKKYKDDIRLLKQFCRSAGVYGAESYIQGFSGYICEILAIYYKGFSNVIRNAAKWKDKVIIDAANYWKGSNILMELNKSKTHSPLIVIDPVQADRNAAAAISKEKFELFRKRAKDFFKSPSDAYFEVKEINEEMLRKKAGDNVLILIDAAPKQGKEDVIGCKLVKALSFVNKKLKENGFNVIDHGWRWDKKVLFYFIVKKERLSEYVEREGPPLNAKQHVTNFKKKYKKTFIKGGRIFARVDREYKKPVDLFNSLKNEAYLKEKIKKLDIR